MWISHVEAYFHIAPISTDYRRGLFSDKSSNKCTAFSTEVSQLQSWNLQVACQFKQQLTNTTIHYGASSRWQPPSSDINFNYKYITTELMTKRPPGGLRGCLQAGPRLLGDRRALPGTLLPAALLPSSRAHVPRQGGEGDALVQGLWHLPEPGRGARILPAGHPWPYTEVFVGPLWKTAHLPRSAGGASDLD